MHPLKGIRVIDLGSYISAPYAAMLLAELGADVIKVERPGASDPTRGYVVNGRAPIFCAFNRNKRDVVLDYAHPAGLALLEKLVATADILLINVRPGVEQKLGIDAARLQSINPRLIYCSITGFGATGPYARRPAYDNVGQALSGLLSRFHKGKDARVPGPAITDNVTAMHACIAVLGALHERSQTGKGRKVEVNLLEAMISFLTEPLSEYLLSGRDQPFYQRAGVSQSYVVTCKDGKRIGLHISALDKFWRAFTTAIGRPDLGERFPDSKTRLAHYDEIAEILAGEFATRDRDAWQPLLEAHDVPFAPELTLPEVEHDPQVVHLGSFAAVDHAQYGTNRTPNRPARFDGDNQSVFRPPPALGEHSDEVLAELGFDAVTIRELREKRIVC